MFFHCFYFLQFDFTNTSLFLPLIDASGFWSLAYRPHKKQINSRGKLQMKQGRKIQETDDSVLMKKRKEQRVKRQAYRKKRKLDTQGKK